MSTPLAHNLPEPDGIEVRPWSHTAAPEASQVLVRKVGDHAGWLRSASYEVAYYPAGRDNELAWLRTQPSATLLPGCNHTADLHRLSQEVEAAWRESDPRYVASSVRYPAVAERTTLRRLTRAETRLLDDLRTGQHTDPQLAPTGIRRLRAGERVIVGYVHELIARDRTRCGLTFGLVRVGGIFRVSDPQACPACAVPAGLL